MERFVYFYFMKNEPDKIRQVAPAHVDYWRSAGLPGYMGGPFADRTGGLISFEAASLEDAAEMVKKDPFTGNNLIGEWWVKEWILE